jgi:DNA-binding response OmpR family regulator
MRQHTLLIATAHEHQRAFLAAQLDADGHTIHEADSAAAAVAKLSSYAIDVMILGDLHGLADAPRLLRSVRTGEPPRIHPGQPVITLGARDELTAPARLRERQQPPPPRQHRLRAAARRPVLRRQAHA